MTSTTQSPPAGTLEYVDPAQLVIEDNVRPSSPVTDEFVATIRQHGVLQPVRARRDHNGAIVVRMGQRRVLAAREAGLTEIPVFVVDTDGQTVERITEQLVENDQRDDITDAQRTAAWRQLELEGLTPTAIAKRTGTKTARVKTGLKVAGNEFASAVLTTHQLTLDQAAALAEFEGDDTTVAELVEVATESPEQFAHAAQRARDERVRAQLKEKAETELAAQGFTILEREPGYYEPTPVRVTDLVDGDGNPVTVEKITGLDGVSAFVRVPYSDEVRVSYFLEDPKRYGFRKYSDSRAAGPMTDEEKAERRETIANNKAWDAAQTVRREWLTQLLGRRTLPKNAPQVIAEVLSTQRFVIAKALSGGNTLANQLLGIPQDDAAWQADRLADYVESHPTKAVHVMLAVVFGGIEESTGRHTWRNPDKRAAAYLNMLARWEYTLSEVEQIVTAVADPAPGGDEHAGTEPDGDAVEVAE